ncbi:cell wall-active antibiotics response protein [Flavihumibacter sp. R14]|nr:cell wall-active antibiotics response protein [Flavihumibacter soli]
MQNFQSSNKKSGKTVIGFMLLALGCILLLRTLDLFFLPGYLFSWPMWLIAIGVYIGARKGYQKPGPFILILLGFIFLAHRIVPDWDLSRFVWPMAIIGFGLWMVLKPSKGNWFGGSAGWDKRIDPLTGEETQPHNEPFGGSGESRTIDDRLNSTSIFGGIKKTIVSKNFKGGEIINFFGGAELNLMQADIQGTVKLEVTQVFGGTKIIIPANWIIHSEMVAVFGGIEDKRLQASEPNPEKILIIDGTSIFGGIDIRSF